MGKKITDWHEEFSPNSMLARAMDLHNNYIGRELFLKSENLRETEIITELETLLQEAVEITSLEVLKKNKTNLVYIKDY